MPQEIPAEWTPMVLAQPAHPTASSSAMMLMWSTRLSSPPNARGIIMERSR